MRKIYVIGNSVGYADWMQGQLVETMEEADLVVLTGGEDVDPRMYEEPRHPQTYANIHRDAYENIEFTKAERLGKHIIGICRGAQLACVENGGRLIQHQNNPGTHMMLTSDGRELLTSSLHHQAMYPFQLPADAYKVLAWTEDMLRFNEDGLEQEMNPPVECEVVYFPKTKTLGIQGHPEMMSKKSESVAYFRQLLNDLLEDKLDTNEHTIEKEEDHYVPHN